MNRRLRARVTRHTGTTVHSVGTIDSGAPQTVSVFPPAACVEIVEGESGWFLVRFDSDDQFCGDTWHQSFNEAKAAAHEEFEITEDAWSEVKDGSINDQP